MNNKRVILVVLILIGSYFAYNYETTNSKNRQRNSQTQEILGKFKFDDSENKIVLKNV
jgi:hypothetical protein